MVHRNFGSQLSHYKPYLSVPTKWDIKKTTIYYILKNVKYPANHYPSSLRILLTTKDYLKYRHHDRLIIQVGHMMKFEELPRPQTIQVRVTSCPWGFWPTLLLNDKEILMFLKIWTSCNKPWYIQYIYYIYIYIYLLLIQHQNKNMTHRE